MSYLTQLPRWYLAALGILFVCYLGGWAYTVHLAQVERATGYTPVLPVVDHDSTSYANLAQSILHGHFAEPGEQYEYFHTPGYPAFVAAILLVTGSYFAVTLVQILMVFAIALMTYVLGKRLVSPQMGMWASLLFLVNPIVPTNTIYIVTDTVFTFLLIGGFTLLVTQFTKRPLVTTVAAAVIFGIATYVRPVGFIAYPIFALPLLALDYPWRKKIGYAVFMLAIVSALLVPWMLRNKADSGVFSFTSLVPFNMSYYSIPHFWSDTQHVPLDVGLAKVEQDSGVPRGLDANGYPANWYNLASSPKLTAFYTHVVLASPITYVIWHLYNSTAFFVSPAISPAHLTQNIKLLVAQRHFVQAFKAIASPWWFLAERLLLAVGFVFLCIGVWSVRRKLLTWAFVLVILYIAALGGPSTAARYRLPVEPLLSIFMVTGLFAIKPIKKLFSEHAESLS